MSTGPQFITSLGGEQGVLARTMWAEDRGDGATGMSAVGCVIRNRTVIAAAHVSTYGRPHPLFGDGTYAAACLTPWQFSCWNTNDPNRPKLLDVTQETDPSFASALELAAEVIAWTIADPTGGATHYKTTALPWPSAWGPEIAPVAVVGKQSYYILN